MFSWDRIGDLNKLNFEHNSYFTHTNFAPNGPAETSEPTTGPIIEDILPPCESPDEPPKRPPPDTPAPNSVPNIPTTISYQCIEQSIVDQLTQIIAEQNQHIIQARNSIETISNILTAIDRRIQRLEKITVESSRLALAVINHEDIETHKSALSSNLRENHSS